MTYSLDGADIASLGAVPRVDINQECIALSGVFDLPKRKGVTEHNWGTSVEPFVAKEDIELDGLTLELQLCVKGEDYKAKLDGLRNACVSCRKLGSSFGEFDVLVKDTIQVDEYATIKLALVSVKFWQQEYTHRELLIQPSGNGRMTLDGYDLSKDFGIYTASCRGLENMPKRIEVNTTLPYTSTIYREPLDITFSCSMVGNSLLELYGKMKQFHALCIRPGMRTLKHGNKTYNIYFKDGIKVKAKLDTLLKFELKCRVAI